MRNIYVKTTWVDNKTPVNAANLNKIENAIVDLYQNALSVSDFSEGNGVNLNITEDKKLQISVSKDVVLSDTCCGIEVLTSEPSIDVIKNGVLYFIIDPNTKKLVNILINNVAIYEME